jgi:hypothetical protein
LYQALDQLPQFHLNNFAWIPSKENQKAITPTLSLPAYLSFSLTFVFFPLRSSYRWRLGNYRWSPQQTATTHPTLILASLLTIFLVEGTRSIQEGFRSCLRALICSMGVFIINVDFFS